MMSLPGIPELFANPQDARADLIQRCRWTPAELPSTGSSFFMHLSELCPVACEHCMYSSDLERKSFKDSLEPDELERAIEFVNSSHSEKLNITGGGEPFLKVPSILRLLETVKVPRIEIVTAGYWAKTEQAAKRMIARVSAARLRNPLQPEVMLRLSIDRYHINAPKPVRIEHYGNIAKAWSKEPGDLSLGFRSIQPDRDFVDRLLAEEVGGELVTVDDWNRRLVLPNGRSAPITFNVFRVSGKAGQLAERSELSSRSKTIREYYGPFENREGQLVLATTVNDAIRGRYSDTGGLAVTMNSDGRFWIFCGTAPDRQLLLGQKTFSESIAHFFEDPLTRLLVDDGVWTLADIVADLDPAACQAAIAKNDVASLVDDLLVRPEVRLAATIIAMRRFVAEGRLRVDGAPEDHPMFAPEDALVDWCHDVLTTKVATQ